MGITNANCTSKSVHPMYNKIARFHPLVPCLNKGICKAFFTPVFT